MRSLDEIFNEHSFKAIGSISPSKPFCLAAMKEAREEYAKAFFLWVQTVRDDNGNNLEHYDVDLFFWSCDHDGEHPMDTDELMIMFNTHRAAIEAEKERGKNG